MPLVRGKGKCKAKAKAKAKARASAKTQEAGIADTGHNEDLAQQGVVVVPVMDTKATFKNSVAVLRAKVLAEVETKGINQLIADAQVELQLADARIEECASSEEVQAVSVQDARHAFQAAKAEVETAMELQIHAARQCHEATMRRERHLKTGREDAELELLELQQKLTLLEVMAGAVRMRKLVEDAKRRAVEAASEAKMALKNQRQGERDALKAFSLVARGQKIAQDSGNGPVQRTAHDLELEGGKKVEPCLQVDGELSQGNLPESLLSGVSPQKPVQEKETNANADEHLGNVEAEDVKVGDALENKDTDSCDEKMPENLGNDEAEDAKVSDIQENKEENTCDENMLEHLGNDEGEDAQVSDAQENKDANICDEKMLEHISNAEAEDAEVSDAQENRETNSKDKMLDEDDGAQLPLSMAAGGC